jgi:hypothetical protein
LRFPGNIFDIRKANMLPSPICGKRKSPLGQRGIKMNGC